MRYTGYLSLALLSALVIPAAAHADTFNYTATGAFAGTGTITTTSEGGGEFLITAITGDGVIGLIAPDGFNGNDNLVFPSEQPTLDHSGFSFVAVNGPDTFDVNIFNNGSGYFAFIQDEDDFTATIPLDLTFAATTPEPSSYVLFGTGILGLAGAVRRRFRQS